MFEPVPARVHFPQLEEEILRFWKERRIFERSMEQTKGGPRYVFYEGPPTANGLPGIHHVLARAFKDLFPRYKTMRGYYCLRRGGWDTHGLPVELEVEKELGFTSKADIERYGVAEFNRRCRESVFRYVKEWETLTERIAFWIDLQNAYITLSNEYIESVWWILRQFWDRGLLYQSYKVVPYCPRCGTPLSDHEVALGYREDTEDPSVYVKFPLRDEEGTYFLVWTTTPWTLPGNAALAVHPEATYVMVEQELDGTRERLILAEALLEKALKGEYRVVARMPGRELAGLRYRQDRAFLRAEGGQPSPQTDGRSQLKPAQRLSPLWREPDPYPPSVCGIPLHIHPALSGEGANRPRDRGGTNRLRTGQLRQGIRTLSQHPQQPIGLRWEAFRMIPFHLCPDLSHHQVKGLQDPTGQDTFRDQAPALPRFLRILKFSVANYIRLPRSCQKGAGRMVSMAPHRQVGDPPLLFRSRPNEF